MKKSYRLPMAFPVIVFLLLSACNVLDKDEPVPAYVHIDGFSLLKNTAGFAGQSDNNLQDEGSLSHKISDAWFYVDEQLIGCFEMPVTFPVIVDNGVHHVKIKAGIKVNGISATRSPYPFYQIYEQDVDFKQGTTITLSPTTKYEPFSHFAFMEDFEQFGSIKVDSTVNSEVPIKQVMGASVFEGVYSGYTVLDTGNTFMEIASSSAYSLPKSGAPVFLEFNYKSDKQFTVGTAAFSPYHTAAVLNMNASNEWNKAYLYLTPNITPTSSTQFKILMYMSAPGADSAVFLIDNIKIVY